METIWVLENLGRANVKVVLYFKIENFTLIFKTVSLGRNYSAMCL